MWRFDLVFIANKGQYAYYWPKKLVGTVFGYGNKSICQSDFVAEFGDDIRFVELVELVRDYNKLLREHFTRLKAEDEQFIYNKDYPQLLRNLPDLKKMADYINSRAEILLKEKL